MEQAENRSIIGIPHMARIYFFCPYCGKRIASIPEGAKLSAGPKFCQYCGRPLKVKDIQCSTIEDMVDWKQYAIKSVSTIDTRCFAIKNSEAEYPGKYVVRMMLLQHGIKGNYLSCSNKIFLADTLEEAHKFLPCEMIRTEIKDKKYQDILELWI